MEITNIVIDVHVSSMKMYHQPMCLINEVHHLLHLKRVVRFFPTRRGHSENKSPNSVALHADGASVSSAGWDNLRDWRTTVSMVPGGLIPPG